MRYTSFASALVIEEINPKLFEGVDLRSYTQRVDDAIVAALCGCTIAEIIAQRRRNESQSRS